MPDYHKYARRLRGGTAVAVLAALGIFSATSVAAQDADTGAEEERNVDEVVVTGSRIKRSGVTSPSPVTVVDAEEIALQGEVNLANFLNQLPALGSTFSTAASQGFIGTTGLSFLDLRRLGTERTLTLVNGRRHVGSQAGSSAVDVNSIPQELVERVEVLTGGASAVYGADAVAGVVNFILKDNYEGVSVYSQLGQADQGSAFGYTTRVVAGGNFADDKGNAVVSVEWSDTQGYDYPDRSYTRRSQAIRQNPADGDSAANDFNDGIPDSILFEGVRLTGFTAGGLLINPSTGERFVAENGVFRPFVVGESIGNGRSINNTGDGILDSDIRGTLQADIQRIIATANVRYKFRDELNLFVETKYVNTQADSESGTGAFDTGNALVVRSDNAFLTDAQRQFFVDQGIDSLISRRIHQEALRFSNVERQNFRGAFGFDGQFDNGISYDLSYVYGRATVIDKQGNNRINDRFYAGADAVLDPATGQAVCRSDIDPDAAAALPDFAIDGCVPINVIGENAISPEAIAFAFFTDALDEDIEQSVVSLNFSGDSNAIGFSLPAGPIGWAIGGEYRKETSNSITTGIDRLGLTFLNEIPVSGGAFDVYEAYAEINVPLLKNAPFAKDLSLDAALRLSDYSTVGSTTTWNVGLNWAPIDDLRFRGTYSRAVRAPNIGELFGGQSQTFFGYADPCDVDNLDQGTAVRAANCLALGLPADFEQDTSRPTQPGLQGGNPNLDPEKSDSYTIGAVYTPSFVPGLSFTVDYWNFDFEDLISSASFQDTFDRCVDAPSIDNAFCRATTRDAATGQIIAAERRDQNLAGAKASGIDFEVNYGFALADIGAGDLGDIRLRLIGTRLIERIDFPFQDFPDEIDEETGELGDPKWAVNTNVTWEYNDFSVNYEVRYIEKQLLVEQDDLANDPDIQSPLTTGATWYHDIRFGYKLNEHFNFFAGVNNISQKFPPAALSGSGTGSAIFDTLGRYYYAGVRATF